MIEFSVLSSGDGEGGQLRIYGFICRYISISGSFHLASFGSFVRLHWPVNVSSTARLLISLSNLNLHFLSLFFFGPIFMARSRFADDMNLIVGFYSCFTMKAKKKVIKCV